MNRIRLPKIKQRSQKRLGRGYGSGKGGHTSSRGQKGQKSRTKVNVLFEGIKVKKSLIKKLPFQRGRGKNKGLIWKKHPKKIREEKKKNLPDKNK